MAQKCSFWVVFWGFLSPWGPRGVQVGPRCWQATGILSHTMPQPSQVPLWALKSQIWAKKWREVAQICSFWGFLSPWGPRGVQVGPRWWQDTGILSHTLPQPSQVLLWALKSQIWAKNLARNAHFGRFGLPLVKALEGEPFVLRGFLLTVSSAHEYSLQSPNCLSSVSHLSNVSSVSSLSTLSSVRSAYVDPWDMLNNFCF